MLFSLHTLPDRQVILPASLALSPEWEPFPPVQGVEADSWISAKAAFGFPLTPLQRRILSEGPDFLRPALFDFAGHVYA